MDARRRRVAAATTAGLLLVAVVIGLLLTRSDDGSTAGDGARSPGADPATSAPGTGAPPAETRSAAVASVQPTSGERPGAATDDATSDADDDPEPQRFPLRGRVVDGRGEPIPDARLRFAALDAGGPRNSRARSDDDGAFEAAGLIAGQWRVAASATGFRPRVSAVTIPAAEDIEIVLEDDPGFVVTVVDESGAALPSARVTIRTRSLGLPGSRSGSTIAGGTVRLSGFLITGDDGWSGELEVHKEGYVAEARRLTAADIEAGGIEVTLGRGGELRLRIVGADGEPVAGARVALTRSTAAEDSTPTRAPVALRSTPEGEVHFPFLRPGAWTLSVTTTRDGYARPQEITVRRGTQEELVDVQLERGPGRIAGRVTDSAGAPVVLVRVRLKSASSDGGFLPASLESVSGEDGTFVFDGLPAGEYHVEVGGDKYAWQRRDRVRTGGEELAFIVVPPGELAGRVSAMHSVRGYSVRVQRPGYLRTFRFAARRDEFVVRGIPPGTYTVDIVAGGQSVASHEDVEVRAGETTRVE